MENKLDMLFKMLSIEFGITTMEQLKSEMKKTKLNIGIFTSEINYCTSSNTNNTPLEFIAKS